MDVRAGILFFLVLGARWACADVRRLVISDLLGTDLVISKVSDIQINYQVPKKEIQTSEAVVGNKNIFTYCKEFTAQALYYLGANMTQTAIITILEITCSQLHPFKRQLEIIELLLKGCNVVENYVKQCKKLVFEYVPLIMSNVEQLLETRSLCTTFHACEASNAAGSKQASSPVKISTLSES